MNFDEFKNSLGDASSPPTLPPELQALWTDARGDWDAAHKIVQEIESSEAAWVHAYLHRKEGDLGNASYWYARARRPVASVGLDEEWEKIARALLGNANESSPS